MVQPNALIALTTDFGSSFYVGQLKGILSWLAPHAAVVDLTHEILPQDILGGAVVLQDSFLHFPPGTIHVAVVDPGVGTERSIVAIQILDRWIIGPDNGLLSGVLQLAKPTKIFKVTNRELWRKDVSHTFHGRDIMAPVAAHLACGGSPEVIGDRVEQLDVELLPTAELYVSESGESSILGQTLLADRYGNLLSNIRVSDLRRLFESKSNGRAECDTKVSVAELSDEMIVDWAVRNAALSIHARPERVGGRLVRTYGESDVGELIGLVGSGGRLEISVVNGSAAAKLNGLVFRISLG